MAQLVLKHTNMKNNKKNISVYSIYLQTERALRMSNFSQRSNSCGHTTFACESIVLHPCKSTTPS